MIEAPINPGYTNQIFLEGNPIIIEGGSQITNGNKNHFLELQLDHIVNLEYIAVKSELEFIECGEDEKTKATIVKVNSRYRLIKDHDFTADELYPILLNSMQILIQSLLASPELLLPNNRLMPDYPQLKQFHNKLEQLAKDLNHLTDYQKLR